MIVLLLVPSLSVLAFDHPAEEIAAKFNVARKDLARSIERMNMAIALIDEPVKKKATEKAFSEAQKKWDDFVSAEINLYLTGNPLPDTATSTALSGYRIEIKAIESRVKDLDNTASWLEANYKKK